VSPGGVKKTSPNTPATQVESSSTRTNVNETFELNMDERRYSQESFEAATAVETKDSGANLNVQIGVALASGRIDVLLRNVHGRVSFRGSLNRIVEIINNRQATSPSPPAPSSGPVAPPSP
jgi:hypothetical protein